MLVSACSLGTSQQYISSENDDLDFALPNDFEDLGVKGDGFEWFRAYTSTTDAAPDFPLVVQAMVMPLTPEARDVTDLRGLRGLLLDGRDAMEGGDDLRVIRHEAWVDSDGNEGNRMQVDLFEPDGDLTVAHVAAIDSLRTRVAQVRVLCSTDCFIANIDTIDEILDSFRFAP